MRYLCLARGESRRTDSPLDSYSSGVRAAGRKPSIRDFEMRIEYPTREVAGWLEVDEDTQVVVRGSKRFIDDIPYSLQNSYYSMDLVRGSDLESRKGIPRGTIRVLAELGYEQIGYRDEIVARMPTPEEKRFFHIGPGIPVVVVHRVAFTNASTPIRLTVTTYAADRNRRGWVWLPPTPGTAASGVEAAGAELVASNERLVGLLAVLVRQLDQLVERGV